VKTKDAGKGKGWTKQKKQLVALGALTLGLVVVLVVQFHGGETEYQVAALSQEAADAATEPQAAETAAPAAAEPHDNPVLSQAPAEKDLDRNPFKSFWSRDTTEGQANTLIPPPSVVLGITIPGGDRPVAVIDGQLHFLGDTVQGWKLEEVRPRAVVLRSPSQEQLVVEMPLFHSELVLPAEGGSPR